jgi:polyhydroxyalkanoate synthesis repressor PhaR
MAQTPEETAVTQVVIKKYANRRLYNTESSSYITLETLSEMVRAGRDFVVYDAKTSEDITRSVLTQIIVEEEGKVGQSMLPTNFLRQLIGLYGDNMQGMVPRYLESAMAQFGRQQAQMRAAMQQTMGNFLPPGMEEIGKQNIAMMERAMSLFAPFAPRGDSRQDAAAEAPTDEMSTLRTEIDRLHAELDAIKQNKANRT